MKISNPYAGIIRIRLEGMISAFSPCLGREGTPLFSPAKIGLFPIRQSKTYKIAEISKHRCHQDIDNLGLKETSFALGEQR